MSLIKKRIAELERQYGEQGRGRIRFINLTPLERSAPIVRASCSGLEVLRLDGEGEHQFKQRVHAQLEDWSPSARPRLICFFAM